MNKNITATTPDGGTIRLTLPEPTWKGREQISVGVFRTAVYVSPRSKRCVVETDSIWEDRLTHGSVGTRYELVEDADELNQLAGRYPLVSEALERAGLITAEPL